MQITEKEQLKALLTMVVGIHFANAHHLKATHPKIFDEDFCRIADEKLLKCLGRLVERQGPRSLATVLKGANIEKLLGVEL